MLKIKYHIGYTIEDFFSKLILIKFYNKVGNVCFNICSQDFAEYCNCKVKMERYGPGYDLETTSTDEGLT